jgi:hypothetical protein
MSIASTAAASLTDVVARPARWARSALTAKPLGRVAVVGGALLAAMAAWWIAERASGGLSSQSCHTEPVTPSFGAATLTTMRVSSGTECSLSVPMGGVSVDSLVILGTPSNGALRLRGRTGIIYQPAKGFAGEDSFAFAIAGHTGTAVGTAIVRVRATVR